MLTKRIIFTLIYDRGYFMHSRNFSLQRAGDSDWIIKNYNFESISRHIDEIIFLDVSRESFDKEIALNDFKKVTNNCFVPKSYGGRLRDFEDFNRSFQNGADKIVINTLLHDDPDLVIEASKKYGSQSIIGSIDVKKIDEKYVVFSQNGSVNLQIDLEQYASSKVLKNIGEIYLNSIDKDGTGQGFDLETYNVIREKLQCPVILAGGAGNASHFLMSLEGSKVDALATANLFNFIGNGLETTRQRLIENNYLFPYWDTDFLTSIKSKYK